MIPSSEAVDGSVVIVLFNRTPVGGWMLYFKGIKRRTVINKFPLGSANVDQLVTEAVACLADISNAEGWKLKIQLAGSKVDSGHLADVLKLHSRLVYSDDPVKEDDDLFEYLFSTAPNRKGNSRTSAQKRGKPQEVSFRTQRMHPDSATMEPGEAIITSDASYMPVGRNSNEVALGGTGWVIGFHDGANNPEIVLGSRSYLPERHHSSNSMELQAIKDAMEAVLKLDELRSRSSSLVVYSDSDYAITAVRNKKARHDLVDVLGAILAASEELSLNGIEVRFEWVKGHSGNEWNHLAHGMAALGRKGESHDGSHVEKAAAKLRQRRLMGSRRI